MRSLAAVAVLLLGAGVAWSQDAISEADKAFRNADFKAAARFYATAAEKPPFTPRDLAIVIESVGIGLAIPQGREDVLEPRARLHDNLRAQQVHRRLVAERARLALKRRAQGRALLSSGHTSVCSISGFHDDQWCERAEAHSFFRISLASSNPSNNFSSSRNGRVCTRRRAFP